MQIFTLKEGKCKLTEEYFLPPGEHLISLGGGKSKVMSIYAGVTTPCEAMPVRIRLQRAASGSARSWPVLLSMTVAAWPSARQCGAAV
jgi:hypothetical protein